MVLSIFWRLIAGYSVVLLLAVAVACYSIVQLGSLSTAARTALGRDYRLIAYSEKMADIFLSEVRYAGKFIITQAAAHRDQFSQFNKEFERYLNQIEILQDAPELKPRLVRVEEFHRRYRDLFDQEVGYLKAGQPYADSRYRQEREKTLDGLLRELESLKLQLQKALQDKLQRIDAAARLARTIAIATTAILLVLGTAVSFLVSRSITGPIAALTRKTAGGPGEIGGFSTDFSAIPEVYKLAVAIEEAKTRLRSAAAANEAFVASMASEFATPLVSMRRRLGQLEQELYPKLSAEEQRSMRVLAEENERLIRRLINFTDRPPEPSKSRPRNESDPPGSGGSAPGAPGVDLWRHLFGSLRAGAGAVCRGVRTGLSGLRDAIKTTALNTRAGK